MPERDQGPGPRERWLFLIATIIAIAIALFILVIVLNAGTILIGTFLTIFQVTLIALLIILAVGLLLLIIGKVLEAISGRETKLKRELESLRKIAQQATYKSGSEFLNLVSGVLIYFVQ